ncbi:acetoacetate--CoA ligase [Nocardioides sp.]|uniref:acetoacetate--CoA ligase n=1 Tax=Nocardioides sp. TaxID=35761 RepID=UPI003513171F
MTAAPEAARLEREVVWTPPSDWRTTTRIGAFARDAEAATGRHFDDYASLWRWSVERPSEFWGRVWSHFGVASPTPVGDVLAEARMPGARWFAGAGVNYARHLLEDADPERRHDHLVALRGHSQTRGPVTLTFAELRAQVARVRAGLERLGVGPGDRVAAVLPNIPETVVAYLATASLGAVWASCAPEFGVQSVVDRLAQIEPAVLLAVSGYVYGEKPVDKRDDLARIVAQLPGLRHVVHVPYGAFDALPQVAVEALGWSELTEAQGSVEPAYADVAFDHPLCILFSSGTTGLPKAIVHGHGGILLEHLKNHALSWDLGPGDRMLWFSTTAWMMWNALVSCLLVRAGAVLLDGNPLHPDADLQWRLAAEDEVTHLGVSPGFIMAARAAGAEPARRHDLSRVRQIGAAGSPLPAEGYRWIAEQLPGVLLNVGSGGTDLCSGIVQGSPLQPVVAGEISGSCLGVDACAYDDEGREVVGGLGELVIRQPLPSMPVGFWGDTDGSRYRAAYFEEFDGVWRHGDWVRFSESGTCVVAGRSDATLNRGGVRLGTAEFYRVVEELPEVLDSLVVHLEDAAGGMGELLMFVVPAAGAAVDDALRRRIVAEIRGALSPRHVPAEVVAVSAIPRNRTGKKLELPVKRLLQGRALTEVVSSGSLADETALDDFVALAASRAATVTS